MSSAEIWFIRPDPALLNELGQSTLMPHLGIAFTEVGPNYPRATMPVDRRTIQYLGMLHGGASVALAETVASTAANFVINPHTHYAIGLEINANHIRAVREGSVYAHAEPFHLGRQTQVWSILIREATSSCAWCAIRSLCLRGGKISSYLREEPAFNSR